MDCQALYAQKKTGVPDFLFQIRTVKERTHNLIAVTHPDFRAELTRQAKELNYI